MRRFFFSCVILLAVADSLAATEFFLTPVGAGSRTGASWEQAFDQASLSNAVNTVMKPGDRLSIGGGAYHDAELTISSGGKEGKAKTIVGVDRGQGLPVFTSGWKIDDPTRGKTALRFAAGVSHVEIQHLRIRGYAHAVQASPVKEGAARTHLRFDDVDTEHVRHGFYLSDCDDLQLANCDVKRYSKHGIRFDQGCDRVTVRNCTADCSEKDEEWEKKTELLPFGFNVNDGGAPNTHVLFEDCLAANNLMPLQKNKYKNGDGFVVEGNSSDVSFVRCRALRNQDGGFDLKVRDVKLTDCVAIGNGRNFRIWSTGKLVNCFSGWAKTGVWNNGGPLTLERCTFYELRDSAVLADDKSSQPITLSDCIIAHTPKAYRVTAKGKVNVVGSVEFGDRDPMFVRPAAAWNGLGDAMNSRAAADKGYHAPVSTK